MRIAPTTTVLATDLEPNQRIIDGDKRWVIDCVTRRADGIEASCFPAGREVGKRTVRRYKVDESVVVELSPEVGQVILDDLVGALLLSPKCESRHLMQPASEDKAPKQEAEIIVEPLGDNGTGFVLTGTKPRAWELLLEP